MRKPGFCKIVVLFSFFMVSGQALARESDDELKAYLSSMNKVVIEAEEAMRNFSMKILPAKNAAEQITAVIQKFEVLRAPSIFLKDHNSMLLAFKTIRDGLELLSKEEREKSVELVRQGAALLKEAAVGIRTTAENRDLIPVRPKTFEPAKPILPSQLQSVIAGTSPTPSPNISAPVIETGVMETEQQSAASGIDLESIPTSKQVIEPNANSPLMFTTAGEIMSIVPFQDHFLMEIKDASGNKLEISLDSQTTNVLKDNKTIDISQIKKGDHSYIVYTKANNANQALFINLLKPEDAANK